MPTDQFRFAWLEHSVQAVAMHVRGYWKKPCRLLSMQITNEPDDALRYHHQASMTTANSSSLGGLVLRNWLCFFQSTNVGICRPLSAIRKLRGRTFRCALESRQDPQTTHTHAARCVARKRMFFSSQNQVVCLTELSCFSRLTPSSGL